MIGAIIFMQDPYPINLFDPTNSPFSKTYRIVGVSNLIMVMKKAATFVLYGYLLRHGVGDKWTLFTIVCFSLHSLIGFYFTFIRYVKGQPTCRIKLHNTRAYNHQLLNRTRRK